MAIKVAESTDVSVSDGMLAGRVLEGDRAAFRRLYDRRAPLIRAVCYDEARDIEAANDLAQEAFLRAYTRLRQLSDPEKFCAWVLAIARQVCREWRRGRLREGRRIAQWAECGRADRHDGAVTEGDARSTQLREAVAALPEKERLALHAFYLEEMNAEQAREILGLSRSGLYRVLSRARQRLRRLLAGSEMLR